MEPSISKASLLDDGKFYIGQLNHQHGENEILGNGKLNELKANKSKEQKDLSSKRDTIKARIDELQGELNEVEKNISAIDGKYSDRLNSANQSLKANTIAKDNLIADIGSILNGINTYL